MKQLIKKYECPKIVRNAKRRKRKTINFFKHSDKTTLEELRNVLVEVLGIKEVTSCL